MKLYSLLVAAAAVSLVAAQNCTTRCVRKEVRSLTQDERNKYFAALRTVMQNGRYDEFTSIHIRYSGQIHGNPAFLPAHRAMLRELEKALQAVDASVCLHYWSWDVDSQNPAASPIFTPQYYHTDANGGCVNSEWLGGWQPQHPSPHCLRRAFDASNSMSAFTGPEVLNSIIARTTDYDTFRQRIEGNPHASVHVNVGGDMSVMNSPNDPLFYAHHAMIDYIWARWQQVRGNPRLYNGVHWSGNRNANAGDSLDPFPYTVEQVFDTSSLCYTYEEFMGAAQRSSIQLGTVRAQSASDTTPIPLETVNSVLPYVQFKPDAAAAAATTAAADTTATTASTTPVRDAQVAHAAAATNTVAADDKYNLVYIRTPKPIPSEWIKMNNLTEANIRQYEQEYSTIVTQLNSIQGYVSPCALLNRPDLVMNDVKAKKVDKYVCPVHGKGTLEIGLQGDETQAVRNVFDAVRKAAPEVKADPTKYRDQVIALVGEPVMSKQSASNFLTTLEEKETHNPVQGASSDATMKHVSFPALAVALFVWLI